MNFYIYLVVVFLSACGGGSSVGEVVGGDEEMGDGDAGQVDNPPTNENEVTVRVLMDGFGKSRLYIQANDIWWQHINGEAPGLIDGQRSTTFVNNEGWFPEWPEEGANAFCACNSSMLELETDPFVEEVAVETLFSRYVSLIQQPTVSNSLISIIEIDNPSSVPVNVEFTVKLLSEAGDDDIIETMFVNDIENPTVDEAARAIYLADAAERERLDTILAENVELELSDNTGPSLPRGQVYKRDWIVGFSNLLPDAACSSSEAFLACYDVTRNTCRHVLENETNRCLNRFSGQMPDIFLQPNDGTSWGGTVGGCAGDAYAEVLAEWRDPNC